MPINKTSRILVSSRDMITKRCYFPVPASFSTSRGHFAALHYSEHVLRWWFYCLYRWLWSGFSCCEGFFNICLIESFSPWLIHVWPGEKVIQILPYTSQLSGSHVAEWYCRWFSLLFWDRICFNWYFVFLAALSPGQVTPTQWFYFNFCPFAQLDHPHFITNQFECPFSVWHSVLKQNFVQDFCTAAHVDINYNKIITAC